MADKAGGWLHWPERQALESDVVYLENALREHIDLVNLIHFKVKPSRNRAKKRPQKVSAGLFKAFAKAHNASFKKG